MGVVNCWHGRGPDILTGPQHVQVLDLKACTPAVPRQRLKRPLVHRLPLRIAVVTRQVALSEYDITTPKLVGPHACHRVLPIVLLSGVEDVLEQPGLYE